MHLFYSFCFTLGFVLALPYFLFQALLHQKYFLSLRERLGNLPAQFATLPEGGIWIHAVSVGEVLAVLPLVNTLQLKWPDRPLFVSATTLAGQKLAKTRLAEKASIFFFPLDWQFAVRGALGSVRPAIVLVAETEIWPNFLYECRERNVPVILVNGRLSDQSVRRYRLIRRFMKNVLSTFDFCCVQTQRDCDRLLSLGVSQSKIEVCGNLKYEIATPKGIEGKGKSYRKLLGVDDKWFVVVAGSTMKDEEVQVLSAFRMLRDRCPQALLILAPRHPERFKEVEGVLTERAFHYRKRSQLAPEFRSGVAPREVATGSIGNENIGNDEELERDLIKEPWGEASRSHLDPETEVILLDSMGELATLYALADLVFIGGSLVPTGGHNILEPALFSKPVLFGPHMSNFREISDKFLENQAAIRVESSSDLGAKFVDLSRNAGLRRALGERGHSVLIANRGAGLKILRRIELVLSASRV
jgi:3-deoxy-D-manno-octulosonic-acid transferase